MTAPDGAAEIVKDWHFAILSAPYMIDEIFESIFWGNVIFQSKLH